MALIGALTSAILAVTSPRKPKPALASSTAAAARDHHTASCAVSRCHVTALERYAAACTTAASTSDMTTAAVGCELY